MELKEYEKIARDIADSIDDLLMPEEGEEADSLGYVYTKSCLGVGGIDVLRTLYFKKERKWQIRIYLRGEGYEFVLIRKYSVPTDEELERDYAERIDDTQYYRDVLNLLTNFKEK